MNAIPPSEAVVDYAGFDFAGLWSGREKVSEIERTVVGRALARGDARRVLEIGTGFGRLLPTLLSLGGEVLATDLDVASLEARAATDGPARVRRVAANLFHLPFRNGSFTGATMIRVYHHLLEPAAAFRELGRVLRGGARFVVSYKPSPSIGTLVDDIGRALRRNDRPFRSLTFARGPVVLDAGPFPIRSSSRREFERSASEGGWTLTDQSGLGLEEYTILRHAPAGLFVRLGAGLGGAPGFPTRFAVLERSGRAVEDLPEIGSILACPQCRTPQPSWWSDASPACSKCGYVGSRSERVLDLRYLPAGAVRWGVAR
jgi:SAM-dependent methyltransferase